MSLNVKPFNLTIFFFFNTGGECQPGYYCPQGSDQPLICPGGYYCPTKRMSNYSQLCDAGYYCNHGSSTRTPIDGIMGEKCPEGKYCEVGTHIPTDCPNGTYSNATGKLVYVTLFSKKGSF